MRRALLLVLAVLLPACGYYSFTGASIPPHLGTVAVPLVQDQTTNPLTTLAVDETLTELLTDRFVRQTRLRLEPDESEADAVLEVRVVRYTSRPTGVGGGEQATLNELTIAAQVRYLDQVRDTTLLDRQVTASLDYDPSAGDPSAAEAETALAVLENLADDIFTAATSNW